MIHFSEIITKPMKRKKINIIKKSSIAEELQKDFRGNEDVLPKSKVHT